MILEKQKEASILQQGQSNDSIGMSLDMESANVLMQMLSKNLYSDAIGSTIRECASNALDSHRRIGDKDTPIIVGLKTNNNGNYEFTVEDFGTGLDDDDVRNIISKYGKSTKRNSNNELGMMGLGFKAPLAYASSFYFIARKDGKERKYIMYEGEDTNTIDLLYENDTDQKNGVKIIIPVNYLDKSDFVNKMKEQLCYFENVYFDCSYINNGFTIFRGKHFQYSELCSDNKLHVCLDNVYYPLDFSKLGISQISAKIGIKLSLTDGVFPTPNRESLRYTKEAKEIILQKIKAIANNLVIDYNKSISETESLKDLYDYFENTLKYVHYDFGSISINAFVNFSDVKCKNIVFKHTKTIDTKVLYMALKSTYNKFYTLKYYYDGHRVYDTSKSGYTHQFDFCKTIKGEKVLYTYSESIKGIHKDYIRWVGKSGIVLRKNKKPLKLFKERSAIFEDNSLYKLLNLNKVPRAEWRNTIKEFYSIVDILFSAKVELSKLTYSDTFLDSRKKIKNITYNSKGEAIRKKKREGEILCKLAEPLERYVDGKECKFTSHSIFLEKLRQYKYIIVYTEHKNSDDFQKIFKITEKHTTIKFMTFSSREIAKIEEEDSNKLISFLEFMKGKTKHFQKIATTIYVKEFLNKYYDLRSKKDLFKNVKTDVYKDIVMLENYLSKNKFSLESNIEATILNICQQNYMLDPNITEVVDRMERVFTKLDYLPKFINAISYGYDKETMSRCLSDIFKYNKIKLDLHMYRTNIVKEEEEITENI